MKDKTLKVAVCLTGLVLDNSITAKYLRHQFDQLGKEHNIEFDYYCHFWKNDTLYPYTVNEEYLGIVTLPKENSTSVNAVIQNLEPKDVGYSNYCDMFDLYFHEGMSMSVDFNIHTLDKFVFKTIDENFFIELNPKDPTSEFDRWWELHNDWILFAHLASQFYAASQCLKSIVNSEIKYDAILKWRYDQIFLPTEFHVKILVEALMYPNKNTLTTSWMCRGSELSGTLTAIEKAVDGKGIPLNTTIGDSWWIVDYKTAGLLSAFLPHAYANVRKYKNAFFLELDGQHIFFYYALLSLKIDVFIAGNITPLVIRNPTLLPPLDNFDELLMADTALHFELAKHHIKASPLAKKMMEDVKNKKHFYHTIKYFKFV